MKKHIFLFLGLLCSGLLSIGQKQQSKTLFIIDSIPIFDVQEAAKLLPEEIADAALITNKDSLLSLGWKQMDTVHYLFTKEYRKRADSLKRTPSLQQLVLKEGSWHFSGVPYSGKFIDYDVNGRRLREGTVRNGYLEGELIVYYPNGFMQSVTHFESGLRHGFFKQYYKNGTLMRVSDYSYGMLSRTGPAFFPNGQVQHQFKPKENTAYDTSITYYSTGKIRKQIVSKSNFSPDKKEEELQYYRSWFYQSLTEGKLKQANNYFYKMWQLDSGSADTYFSEGLLLASEFRFDAALAQLDKALAIEPLSYAALEQRILTRIKKYKFEDERPTTRGRTEIPVVMEDFMRIPEEEKTKVCHDLFVLDLLDTRVLYSSKTIPESILRQCKKNSSR